MRFAVHLESLEDRSRHVCVRAMYGAESSDLPSVPVPPVCALQEGRVDAVEHGVEQRPEDRREQRDDVPAAPSRPSSGRRC
jgi:hypothetical protein